MAGLSSARRMLILLVLGIVFATAIGTWIHITSPSPPSRSELPAQPTPTPTPIPPDDTTPRLAVGITEFNPGFLWHPEVKLAPYPWRVGQRTLHAMRPDMYRLVIHWNDIQPRRSSKLRWRIREDGCMRKTPPCLGWRGVREQLQALASQQRYGGWEVLVVMTGTPRWAGQRAACAPRTTESVSRAPRVGAMRSYRRVLRSLHRLARREGVVLRYWSPWNEPNHPYFLAPTRSCSTDQPNTKPYITMARNMQQVLERLPGNQELVLGELAGITNPESENASVNEWIRSLPQDLACSARVWGQHHYVGGDDPVEPLLAALRGQECPNPPRVWITETGVGSPSRRLSLSPRSVAAVRQCRSMHEYLQTWYAHDSVDVAFQYTLREDDLFRTGLISTNVRKPLPSLRAWRAWGGQRHPEEPPSNPQCSQP